MACLGEYDEASPCPTAYSKRLTPAEHEVVVSLETERQLNSLLTHLEDNPAQFSKLLKKRKIREMEKAGLLSNLKVKVLSAFYGNDSFVDDIDPQTCQEKLTEFKSLSVKVYNYSQEAKGNSHKFARRYSKRIAERTKNENPAPAQPPPPPPPPPPIISQQIWEKNINSKDATLIKEESSESSRDEVTKPVPSTCTNSNLQDEIKTMSRKIVKRKPLGDMPTNPERVTESKHVLESELMSVKSNLRPIGPENRTPYQQSKVRRQQSNGDNQDENRFPLFNQALIQKFKNTRSPANYSPSSEYSPSRSYDLTP